MAENYIILPDVSKETDSSTTATLISIKYINGPYDTSKIGISSMAFNSQNSLLENNYSTYIIPTTEENGFEFNKYMLVSEGVILASFNNLIELRDSGIYGSSSMTQKLMSLLTENNVKNLPVLYATWKKITPPIKHIKMITSFTTITSVQKESVLDGVIAKGVPVIIAHTDKTTYIIGDGTTPIKDLPEYLMITGNELSGYVDPQELVAALGGNWDNVYDPETDTYQWDILNVFDSITNNIISTETKTDLTTKFENAVDAVLSDNQLITETNLIEKIEEQKQDIKNTLEYIESADQYISNAETLSSELLDLTNIDPDTNNPYPLLVTTKSLEEQLQDYIEASDEVTAENLINMINNLAKLNFENLEENQVIDLSTMLTTSDFIVAASTNYRDLLEAFGAEESIPDDAIIPSETPLLASPKIMTASSMDEIDNGSPYITNNSVTVGNTSSSYDIDKSDSSDTPLINGDVILSSTLNSIDAENIEN